MKYARSLWRTVKAAENKESFPERYVDGQRPYMFDGGIFMGGDGSPSAAFLSIYDSYYGGGIEADEGETEREGGDDDGVEEQEDDDDDEDHGGAHPFEDVWNFSGGLHTLMQTMVDWFDVTVVCFRDVLPAPGYVENVLRPLLLACVIVALP